MARSDDDILNISFNLNANVSLDIERILGDPIWKTLCISEGVNEGEFYTELLPDYLNHYILREKLLSNMPSTNGPADLSINLNN